MASQLKGQSPVRISVGADLATGPHPQLLENIPILHQILESIVDDWHRAVAPYESRIRDGDESPEYVAVAAMIELQPALLKCLFSYVLFFVATDRAYGSLYSSLNRVNKLARVNHGKPPARSSSVEKGQAIRDWSIAHFPSHKASPLDAHAAMSWSPLTLGKPMHGSWKLRELTFAGFRLSHTDQAGQTVQSRDLEVQGLESLHRECLVYLEAYDQMCADYLAELHKVAGVRHGSAKRPK